MKKLWLLLPALILAAGLVFMGCPEPDDDDPVPTGDVKWEVTADGVGALGIAAMDTTAITITLNKDAQLQSQNVTFPTSIVDRGTFTKVTDRIYRITVTAKNTGILPVTISRTGFEAGTQNVDIWKVGTVMLKYFTAVADGAANETTSTKITITLDSPMAALDAESFTLTKPAAGAADFIEGDLTTADEGAGLIYDLAITVISAGKVNVTTTLTGYDTAPVSVDLHKAPDIVEGIDIGEPTETGGYKQWDISAEDLATIKAAVSGSQLRVYITVPVDRHDWGLGAIGVAGGGTIELKVPSDQTGLEVYIDVWVAWILEILEEGDTLMIQLWKSNQGAELTGIALIEPEVPFAPPEPPKPAEKPDQVPMAYFDFIQEISTIGGGGADPAQGKGNIEGDDFTAIKEAIPGSILRFYMKNVTDPYVSRNGWPDLGTVGLGGTDETRVHITGGAEYDSAEHLFLFDLPVADLLAKVGNTTTYVFVNPYNQCIVTMCELWSPLDGPTPEKIVILAENREYGNETNLLGYQASESNLFTRIIWEGDEYTLTGKFTSNVAADEILVLLVDTTPPSYWTELSATGAHKITNVVVGEENTVTLTLVATREAVGNAISDMKLVFSTDTLPGAPITLEFWEWTFEKTQDGTEPEEGEEPEVPVPTLTLRNLGEFTTAHDNNKNPVGASQPGWGSNGYDNKTTDLEWAEIAAAKYLVIEMNGFGTGQQWGFGGTRIVLNGDFSASWTSKDTDLLKGGWLGYTRTGTYYMVIDLTKLNGWDEFITGSQGYICIASWPFTDLGFVAGYLTDIEITKPASATDLNAEVEEGVNAGYGYVTNDKTIFDDE